jgi:L-alanine-DL-glutamate epimerase-like enolase superfamily enzyme
MKIAELRLHRVRVPLKATYNLALGALSELDSIIAEVRDAEGRLGIGEATIIPGYTHETVDGGWTFCRDWARRFVGLDPGTAKAQLDPYRKSDPHAVSVLQVAIEMLEGNALLQAPVRPEFVPILGAVNEKDLDRLPEEVERVLSDGFQTIKVKVGWDVDKDLKRVRLIQSLNRGRAAIRIDANQGYTRDDGCRFAASLNEDSVQLFEQPCKAADWEANAAVAALSRVPVMMDESIYGADDIERAAKMKGCGYVKLKIGKMTGCNLLRRGLERLSELGLGPIVGNGAATDIGCFIEASVARGVTPYAGEMNGYLKNKIQLLDRPLEFRNGAIVLVPGFEARLDHRALERLDRVSERYAATTVGAT